VTIEQGMTTFLNARKLEDVSFNVRFIYTK